MADATLPKITFLTDTPLPYWNSAVSYVDFHIENAHNVVANTKYFTKHMVFETNPNRSEFYLSMNLHADTKTIGIFIHQHPRLEVKIIYNLTMFPNAQGSLTIGSSSAKHMQQGEAGWGFDKIINMPQLIEAEQIFQAEQTKIQYIPEELRPAYTPYKLRGRFYIRFPEATDRQWQKMMANPHTYLYLPNKTSTVQGIYPKAPANKTSLESFMTRMLEHVESDQGVVTIKVGPDAVAIPVNSCIIQSRIGVPLLREGHSEATTKEINLPHVSVDVFKVFLHYLYTQKLSDVDLHKFPMELLELANMYFVTDLFYKIEYYLCWKTQNYPASVDIIATLNASETYGASTLKQACFATIFAYGQHLLSDFGFNSLSPKLTLEMLRDFAQRRSVHMPEMPVLPPAMPVMEEDEEAGKQKKRKGSRNATGV
jgi:uncharacterized beta-barrel protein YwiB (DUF1934 family)